MMIFHPLPEHTAHSQPHQIAQAATTASTGGWGGANMPLSEIIFVSLPKQGGTFRGACISNGNMRTCQTSVFQSRCYHSCHQNFTVCTQRAVLAKMRADTSLELQGHRNQQLWDITFFFKANKQMNKTKQHNKPHHKRKHWRITQHSYSYGTDNCCQLTSGPDPSSDLIAALASSFSSYVLMSGPNPKSKAAISRISTLFTDSTIGRGVCTQPAPEGARTQGTSLLEAGPCKWQLGSGAHVQVGGKGVPALAQHLSQHFGIGDWHICPAVMWKRAQDSTLSACPELGYFEGASTLKQFKVWCFLPFLLALVLV